MERSECGLDDATFLCGANIWVALTIVLILHDKRGNTTSVIYFCCFKKVKTNVVYVSHDNCVERGSHANYAGTTGASKTWAV